MKFYYDSIKRNVGLNWFSEQIILGYEHYVQLQTDYTAHKHEDFPLHW